MKTAAIILAAGFSTRMGAPNKLVQHVAGKAVLASVADAVLGVSDTVPLVILGHESGLVSDVLDGLPVDLIENPDPARGQASSVRLGLEEAPQADATLVVLGDQPFLTTAALQRLLRAHESNGGDRITVPVNGEMRGNPVVIPWALRQSILAGGANIGCGSFTRKNPELTRAYPTEDAAYFLDIDTPQDLEDARLRSRGELAS